MLELNLQSALILALVGIVVGCMALAAMITVTKMAGRIDTHTQEIDILAGQVSYLVATIHEQEAMIAKLQRTEKMRDLPS